MHKPAAPAKCSHTGPGPRSPLGGDPLNDPTAPTSPTPDIPGMVREAAAELARISHALDTGVQPTITMSTMLNVVAVNLRDASALMTGAPVDDGTTSVRAMLACIAGALDIPQPDGPEDIPGYLKTRSLRAGEVVRACRAVIESPDDSTARNWRWATAWLATAIAEHGTDGYAHAGEVTVITP